MEDCYRLIWLFPIRCFNREFNIMLAWRIITPYFNNGSSLLCWLCSSVDFSSWSIPRGSSWWSDVWSALEWSGRTSWMGRLEWITTWSWLFVWNGSSITGRVNHPASLHSLMQPIIFAVLFEHINWQWRAINECLMIISLQCGQLQITVIDVAIKHL